MPCSNAGKTRNPLKFAGVPQTRQQPLVGRSSPYYENMWRTYRCLTSFFRIVDTCLSCEDIGRRSCAMVPRWWLFIDFLGPALSASRAQHVSDLHYKFTLECGPMPNVMVALPNINGALCSTPQFGWRPLLECGAVTLPRRETRSNYLGAPN